MVEGKPCPICNKEVWPDNPDDLIDAMKRHCEKHAKVWVTVGRVIFPTKFEQLEEIVEQQREEKRNK